MEHSTRKIKSNRYCSVPQCSSSGLDNVSFHYFPKDKILCKEWLIKLRINKRYSKYMNACSLHFKETDYLYPGIGTTRLILRKGSVPSQNLPKRNLDKKPSSQLVATQRARANRAERRRIQSETVTLASSTERKHNMPVEATTTTSSEVIENSVVKKPQFLTMKKVTDDKGIQVTSTISEKRIILCDMIKTNNDLNAFTGIPTINLLENISEAASMFEQKDAKPLLLSLKQRIVLVFTKLKIDLTFPCMSVLFGVSSNTCKNYFQITLEVLSEVLKPTIPWLEKEAIQNRMPASLNKFYNSKIVLDCIEIALQKNQCLRCCIMTYSHYKGDHTDHTLKVLIGIAQSGLITFLSPVYGESISDKELFLQSGLLDKLIPNEDAIMVNKDFLIENECIAKGIKLIRPPFLGQKKQLSVEDTINTAEIASARVNFERTVQRLKNFKILKGRINLYIAPYMDSIIKIISGVVNLSAPVLSGDLKY